MKDFNEFSSKVQMLKLKLERRTIKISKVAES